MIRVGRKNDEPVIRPDLEELAQQGKKKLPKVDPWAIVLTLAILAGTYTVYRQKHKIEEKEKGIRQQEVSSPSAKE